MKSTDLLIIGAGIQGASAAYNLAKRGYGRILVVERDGIHDRNGSTPRSASMVMQQTGNRRLSEIARMSYEILQSLEDELGVPIPFIETGSILYGTTGESGAGGDVSSEAALRKLLEEQNELGIVTEWVDSDSLPARSAGLLSGEESACGICCEQDGYTDGMAVRDAYLEAFERLGGEVWFDVDVAGIDVRADKVESVSLSDGRSIVTDAVLNCAGIHAGAVSAWIGVEFPLTIDRRFLAILERPPGVPEKFPILEDLRHEWYFRAHERGVLLGVGPTQILSSAQLAEGDPLLDEDSELLARRYMKQFVPGLAEAPILESWAGRRPMICDESPADLADVMPRVGRVAELNGMWQSAGWGAFGITLAFIGGELIAQHICGEEPSADLGDLS